MCVTTSCQRPHAICDHQSKILQAFSESLTIESSCKRPPLVRNRDHFSLADPGEEPGAPTPPPYFQTKLRPEGPNRLSQATSSRKRHLTLHILGSRLLEVRLITYYLSNLEVVFKGFFSWRGKILEGGSYQRHMFYVFGLQANGRTCAQRQDLPTCSQYQDFPS